MYSNELKNLRYCHFYFNRRKYWKGTVLSLPCSLCVALNACFKLRDCAGCITRKGTTGLNYKREMHSGAAPLRECQLFKVLPRQGQGQNNSFYLSATKIPRSFWPQANNLTKFSLKKKKQFNSLLLDCWSFVWPIEPWSGIWYRASSFPFLFLHCWPFDLKAMILLLWSGPDPPQIHQWTAEAWISNGIWIRHIWDWD